MISNDIKHHPDVTLVARADQIVQLLLGTEVLIDTLPIEGAITMVVSFSIVRNWRDPDGIEAHTLDIVELVLNAAESTATVVVEV